MKIINGQENLSCIKFSSFFIESFALSQMSEHFSSSDEVHHKEYLFFGLKSILKADQKGMLS